MIVGVDEVHNHTQDTTMFILGLIFHRWKTYPTSDVIENIFFKFSAPYYMVKLIFYM